MGKLRRPPRLFLTVGAPASGKSAWARRQGIPVVSSDKIRRGLVSRFDRKREPEVWRGVERRLREQLRTGGDFVLDATNWTRRMRRPYIRMARRRGYRVVAVFFDRRLQTLLRRNRGRKPYTPAEVVRWFHESLEPPERSEGFSRVVRR